MIAYCCDGNACTVRFPVVDAAVLPKGWLSVEMEEGTGVMNNPKKKHHLCPECAGVYKKGVTQTHTLQR